MTSLWCGRNNSERLGTSGGTSLAQGNKHDGQIHLQSETTRIILYERCQAQKTIYHIVYEVELKVSSGAVSVEGEISSEDLMCTYI